LYGNIAAIVESVEVIRQKPRLIVWFNETPWNYIDTRSNMGMGTRMFIEYTHHSGCDDQLVMLSAGEWSLPQKRDEKLAEKDFTQ